MDNLIQVHRVLSEEQAAQLVSQLIDNKDIPFYESTVYVNHTHVPSNVRTSTQCILPEGQAQQVLDTFMMKALINYCKELRGWCPGYARFPNIGIDKMRIKNNAWQVLSYVKSQKYDWHIDQLPETTDQWMQREYSVVLYLQNAEKGGETVFPHKSFKPNPGEALIFPSNWCFPHHASAVEEGRKVVAVNWYECELFHKPEKPLDKGTEN